MLRCSLLRLLAAGALVGGLLASGTMQPACAGGWSFKKVRRSVEHRFQDARRLERRAGKTAGKLATEAARAGLRLKDCKAVAKTGDAVQGAASKAATEVQQGARVVAKTVHATPGRVRWGFRAPKECVVAEVRACGQDKPARVDTTQAPCGPSEPC